jgi:hypothetical protein
MPTSFKSVQAPGATWDSVSPFATKSVACAAASGSDELVREETIFLVNRVGINITNCLDSP